MSVSTDLSREWRKSDMLFLKLASATCRAPQTMPSMVSGLSACRHKVTDTGGFSVVVKHK